jgi:hypothetical protein
VVPKRIATIKASDLLSSYKKKYKPKERWDVSVFKEGAYIVPDMLEALRKLEDVINSKGGNLYIIDLYRSWNTQEKARNDFLKKKKKDFVAAPGKSFHNAGRAVDISVQELNFAGRDKDEWLQILWNMAIPLGFRPVISIPDINASEAWHMDYMGEWRDVYENVSYYEAAKCATLDIGGWDPKENSEKIKKMFIQSQLLRLRYYEIGPVDGIIGDKTNWALRELKFHLHNFSLDDIIGILMKK